MHRAGFLRCSAFVTSGVVYTRNREKSLAEDVPKKFKGRTILITGGAGQFGSAGAVHFVKNGANVVLIDVNRRGLDEAVDKAQSESADGSKRVIGLICDIRDIDSVEKVVAEASAEFGDIHYLWNNAGYQGDMKPTLEYSSNDFKQVMEINVCGAFNVLQVVARAMAKQGTGGAICQTGSVAGLRGTPTMPAYVASKAAIHGITLTAAKDLAPHRIRVNTVMPALIGPDDGFMWNRQNQLHALSGSPYFSRDPHVVAKSKLDSVPLKRLGTVEEVVNAVSFLLSDDSSYITGTQLVVAGGLA